MSLGEPRFLGLALRFRTRVVPRLAFAGLPAEVLARRFIAPVTLLITLLAAARPVFFKRLEAAEAGL
jgi:hypothetical protein